MEPQTRNARWQLLAATVCAPFVLLLALELALRATGVGRLETLFIPVDDAPGYLQPNPDVVRRFFPDPDAAPHVEIDTTYFAARKPAGTLRVFVMGESSAAGFPYGRWASPGEFLHERLQRGAADRNIEVISTAMSAVTSYVLLDFVPEILAAEPDAVVIYTGHNEYLGIGGVGSSYVAAESPWLARLTARLRHLRLYRVLERTISPRIGPGAVPTRGSGTLMARVAREKTIPAGSVLYRRGLEQFGGNMERIIGRFAQAGVPVFIGTLASNERDQAPFETLLAESTDGVAWRAQVTAARVALRAGEPARAMGLAREALARDDSGADAHYVLAQALDALGRYTQARAAYIEARDRDALRFRAPSDMNEVIRSLARDPDVHLVDVEQSLASRARNGIIGSDLMLEHLHPNVTGYFALASAFYEPLRALAGAGSVDESTAWKERPTTEIDVLGGRYRIEILKNDWPFVAERREVSLPAPTTPIEQIAEDWFARRIPWAEAMNRALVAYQQGGNPEEAARVAVNLAEAFVQLDDPQAVAGRLLLRADSPARAAHYLGRAFSLAPTNVGYGLTLAEAEYKSGDRAAAAATLESLTRLAPDDPRPRKWLAVVQAAAPAQ
jgi:Tfp pilus assembly protein PilF